LRYPRERPTPNQQKGIDDIGSKLTSAVQPA
jgi:hypothetical protein